MSHPYFPQGLFMYRRRKGSPSLPSYGSYEGVTDPVVKAQPIAAKTFAAGRGATPNAGISAVYARRTMGSLSPKTEWATPSYVRDERSGVGFGDQATAQLPMSGGLSTCVEQIPSKLGTLGAEIARKVLTSTVADAGYGPLKISSVAANAVAGAVNKTAAMAALKRMAATYEQEGGTTAFATALDEGFLTVMAAVIDSLPQTVKTPLVSMFGDSIAAASNYLKEIFRTWLTKQIDSCKPLPKEPGQPDPSQTADALNAAVCNPNPTQTGEVCCGGGIFLKYQQRCAATQEDYATGLQIEQVLMTQQMMKGGVSPTFQAALPGISFAKALTTAQINAGFGTKLTAGLVQVKGQINPIFAKNCVSGGGVAYLDAAGWQKCAPIGTVVPGSGVPPVATSSKTTMFLIGAAIVGIALLAGKKKGQ